MPSQLQRIAAYVWAFAKAHIRIQTGQAGRSLTAGAIFWRFIQDTALTGAILLVLIGATHILRVSVATLKDSPVHHTPLELLEHGIFYSGCFMLFLVALFVTIISMSDLYRWFVSALQHTEEK